MLSYYMYMGIVLYNCPPLIQAESLDPNDHDNTDQESYAYWTLQTAECSLRYMYMNLKL